MKQFKLHEFLNQYRFYTNSLLSVERVSINEGREWCISGYIPFLNKWALWDCNGFSNTNKNEMALCYSIIEKQLEDNIGVL